MRQIKFRAWDGGMYHNVVIVGDLWTEDLVRDNWHSGNVMQFTGLTDKNGKEIYEGDIVSDVDPKCKWVIVFGKYGWCIKNPKYGHCTQLINDLLEELEVIGNVHENPELLNPHNANKL